MAERGMKTKALRAARDHIHSALRPECAEDCALLRAAPHIPEEGGDARAAFVAICELAAVPREHYRDIVDKHFVRPHVDIEALLLELGADRDDQFRRAWQHVKPHMSHEEMVAMGIAQLGLHPQQGAR
jgi:hypothetical protein